jgi:nucleotide-binding universal stress UspA family protein
MTAHASPARVLLATDGSGESAPVVRLAVELATANGWELHVIHAISTRLKPPFPHFWEQGGIGELKDRKRVGALALLEEKVRQVEAFGGEVAGSHYREGRPAREVARLADELGAVLVVTGGRRSGGLGRLLAPGFAESVYLRARCATLVLGVPGEPPATRAYR